jgi:hypothetical protein
MLRLNSCWRSLESSSCFSWKYSCSAVARLTVNLTRMGCSSTSR